MATKLQRNRKDFSFTNALPFTKVGGTRAISASDRFWRSELERLHNHLQDQFNRDFEQIAIKLLELEERIEVLEP